MALQGILRVWQSQVHETQDRRKLSRLLLMHSERKLKSACFSFWLRQLASRQPPPVDAVEDMQECIGCAGISGWMTRFRTKAAVRPAFEALVRTARRSSRARRQAEVWAQRRKSHTIQFGLGAWSKFLKMSQKERALLKKKSERLKGSILLAWYQATCTAGKHDKKLFLFYGLSLEDIARQRTDLFMHNLRLDICACLNILEFYVDVELDDDIDGAVVIITLHSISQRSVWGVDLFESLWAKLSDPWSDLRQRPSTSELICAKTNVEFAHFLKAKAYSMSQCRVRHKVLVATVFFSWREFKGVNSGLRGVQSAFSLIARRRLVHGQLRKWRGHVTTRRKQLRFLVRHQNQRLHAIIVRWNSSSQRQAKALRGLALFLLRRLRAIWTLWTGFRYSPCFTVCSFRTRSYL